MSLVSIIIPLFNSENYIAQTLQSCIDQGNCVKEIIVVDDHSTDNSWDILTSYQSRYPNLIRIEKNIGKGGNQARNYGLSLSTGEYIQWLDADDILSPNKIESQLKMFEIHGNNIIVSCGWTKFESNIIEGVYIKQSIDKDYNDPIEWLVDSWKGKGMGQTGIWLTPRNILEKAGKWNEDLIVNQDGEYFARVLLNSEKLIFTPEVFMFYRTNIKTSVSKNNTYESSKSKLLSYHLYEIILLNKDNNNVRKAIARNYYSFVYENFPNNPDLIKLANSYIEKLSVKNVVPVGGKNFILISNVIGFRNALILKKYLKIK